MEENIGDWLTVIGATKDEVLKKINEKYYTIKGDEGAENSHINGDILCQVVVDKNISDLKEKELKVLLANKKFEGPFLDALIPAINALGEKSRGLSDKLMVLSDNDNNSDFIYFLVRTTELIEALKEQVSKGELGTLEGILDVYNNDMQKDFPVFTTADSKESPLKEGKKRSMKADDGIEEGVKIIVEYLKSQFPSKIQP